MPEEIDTSNKQLVSLNGESNSLIVMMPAQTMSYADALLHAAWLVVMAERKTGEFNKILTAVKNT